MKTPLHQTIRDDIADRIKSGVLAPGARLPVEHEMQVTYACSRMTVHKALTALVQAGLVERRKKAGSFVAAPQLSVTVLEIPDIEAQARARGESYEFRLLSRAVHDGVLELSGLHIGAGRPLCFEHRLIVLATVPAAADIDFSAVSPGSWLLQQVPWSQAENRIHAVAADRDMAGRLDLDPGAACLRVDRETWHNGQRVTFVQQTFDGAHFHLVARF